MLSKDKRAAWRACAERAELGMPPDPAVFVGVSSPLRVLALLDALDAAEARYFDLKQAAWGLIEETQEAWPECPYCERFVGHADICPLGRVQAALEPPHA